MIKDSGSRREFETGAVRDIQEGKGRCDLMPLNVAAAILEHNEYYGNVLDCLHWFLLDHDVTHLYDAIYHALNDEDMFGGCVETMLLEVAVHFEEGAKKYGENNWQKGLPISCYIDSATRHYLKWERGDKDERHDRAFVWNLMCCAWEVGVNRNAERNDPMANKLSGDEYEAGYKNGRLDSLKQMLVKLGFEVEQKYD